MADNKVDCGKMWTCFQNCFWQLIVFCTSSGLMGLNLMFTNDKWNFAAEQLFTGLAVALWSVLHTQKLTSDWHKTCFMCYTKTMYPFSIIYRTYNSKPTEDTITESVKLIIFLFFKGQIMIKSSLFTATFTEWGHWKMGGGQNVRND